MKHLSKHQALGIGQTLLAALESKQALAKVQRGRPPLAKAQKPATVSPVRDCRGQINEAATLIKAAHARRITHRG